MVSTYTTNRHLEKPAHNDYIDTWEIPVNSNSDDTDAAFGGVTSINVTSGSGTVTLSNDTASPPSYICPIFKLSGTLTANINYQFPSGIGGNYVVSNAATGAFTITFSSAGGGTSYVVPAGTVVTISVDGTNVIRSGTAAAGSTTQVVYNSAGVEAGSANLTFDGTNATCGGYFSGLTLRVRGATSGYVAFAAASVAGSTTYTWPSADGTNGQALTTNGAGTLSWTTISGGGGGGGVTTFAGGSTGLTPASATAGAITLAGTLAVANGGTGATTAATARSALDVPSTGGTGASGTWPINISGASASATSAGTATTATTANALNTGNTYTMAGLTVNGTVTVNGAITATGNITAAFSDDRLKDRSGRILHALDIVDRIDGFYYRPNRLALSLGASPEDQVGVSAQAVRTVLPEVVRPSPLGDDYLTVDYSRLVPLLIEAVKELRLEIEAMKK